MKPKGRLNLLSTCHDFRRLCPARAEFLRFVELDVPFEIVGLDRAVDDRKIVVMTFCQLDRDMAKIELRVESGVSPTAARRS